MFVKHNAHSKLWHVITERNRSLKVVTACGQPISLGRGVETDNLPNLMCSICGTYLATLLVEVVDNEVNEE